MKIEMNTSEFKCVRNNRAMHLNSVESKECSRHIVMAFDLGEYQAGQYQAFTRSGLKVLSREPNSSTVIEDADGNQFLENHKANGFLRADETPHELDLIMYKIGEAQ